MMSKSGSARNLIGIALFLAVCALAVVGSHHLGERLVGNWGNQDFMTFWAGSRAVTMGLDPYDAEVWPELRARYGSQWMPNPTCPYPLWTLIAFVPLSLLPLRVAAAVWMTVSEIAVFLTVLLVLHMGGHYDRRRVFLVALGGAFLSRPLFATLFTGQLSALLTLLVAIGVLTYEQGGSFLAGLVFATLLLKPNLFILFFPALGLLLLARRDWSALFGLGSGSVGLLVFSWLLDPGWVWRWMGVTAKTAVTFGTPSIWGLITDLVGPERWILPGTAGVCLVSGLTLFLLVRRKDAWLPGIGLALCASLFVTPYLWAYDQLLLLIPALIAFHSLGEPSLFRTVGWWSSLVVGPWVLFWIAGLRGSDSLSGLVPLGVAGYLCVAWEVEERRPI